MGACMSNKKGQVYQPKSIQLRQRSVVSKEANILLDQWNEKHIELLKNKFYECIQKEKKSKAQGLDKQAFLKVFADLKTFPRTVAESAFKLFDRDKSGYIDFREFCCGLSIICLSGTNEKIRFVFDLFDLDRDGYLNRVEVRTLLETSVMSFRKFSSSPGEQVDKQWIDHNFKIMLGDQNSYQDKIDFITFKLWAETNLNVYRLLNTFELVPSPIKERKTILEILQNYQRKHGDTMYALSYRWWDMWKQYTTEHQSTIEQHNYIEHIKESLIDNQDTPEFIKNFLKAYYEEQKEGDFNEFIQKNELVDYKKNNKESIIGFTTSPVATERKKSKVFELPELDPLESHFEHSMIKDTGRRSQNNKLQGLKLKDHLMSKRSLNYSTLDDNNSPRLISNMNQQNYNSHSFLPPINNPNLHQYPLTDQDLHPGSSFQLLNSKLNQPLEKQHKQIQSKQQLENSIVAPSSNESFKLEKELPEEVNQKLRLQINLQDERPSEIDNSDIEGEHPGQLKPNLILHRDFIMIPEEAWNFFVQWYGGGPAFPRKVIINNTIPTIELYPPLITSILAGVDGHPVQGSARSLFVSIAMKLSEVFLKICEKFNYISTKDTRLWFKEGGKEWQLIEKQDLEKSLEDFVLKDGDVFMVEVKFGEKWPRDEQGQGLATRDWRNFEVGDRIDIFDNNEWKIGRIVRVFKDKLKVHIINEHWKNDLEITKDSKLIERYGSHTLEILFKDQSNQHNNDELHGEVVGIDNIGNTCYMAAILQSLFHTPLFRDFFISQQYQTQLNTNKKKVKEGDSIVTLAQSYADLIIEAKNVKSSIQPISFKKVVNQELPMFFGNQQHDSQEFLSFFLDKLSEELNRIEDEKEENKLLEERKGSEQKPSAQNSQQKSQEETKVQTASRQSEALPEMKNEKQFEINDGGTGGIANNNNSQEFDVQQQIIDLQNEQSNQEERAKFVEIEVNIVGSPPNQKETKGNPFKANNNTGNQFKPQMGTTTNEQIYNSYFQPTLTLNTFKMSSQVSPIKDKDGQIIQSFSRKDSGAAINNFNTVTNFNIGISPLLLDPKISELERKSIEAWEKEMKTQSSAITDLFVGQQVTTVECQTCMNRTFAFENFYTMSLPLPYNSKAIFYITVVKRSSQHLITPIIKYGFQVEKNAKLLELVNEIEKTCSLPINKMLITEIVNNKIFKIYDDLNLQLKLIHRKTNELVVYECLIKQSEFPIMPKKLQSIRGSTKGFKTLAEMKVGMILDAQDIYGKWYVGIAVDRDFDFDNQQNSIKVHFYEFPERWDEWYNEEKIARLAPFGTYTDEPKDKIYQMCLTHRRVIINDETNQTELQTIGMPMHISLGNWFTWEQAYVEVVNQAQRFVKQMKYQVTKSQRAIVEENENISDEEMGEEKSSKIYKYDSSYFSKKMANVDKKGKPYTIDTNSSQGNMFLLEDQMLSLGKRQSEVQDVKNGDIQLLLDRNRQSSSSNFMTPQVDSKAKMLSERNQKYNAQQRSYNDNIIQTLGQSKGRRGKFDGLELVRYPFKVVILEQETHLCCLCLFKSKYSENKTKEPVKCTGCNMYQSNDKMKWILGCFKRFEICIDWEDSLLYKNPIITSDISCLRLIQQEKEFKSGIQLGQCLDLYTKKEKIDDYSCDNCKDKTIALVDVKVSRAPDILVIHLKRFSYQMGYLEKIEDLVTFPINNLDVGKQMTRFKKKNQLNQYDLYAVVNHIMYHTSGGHYTSFILNEQQVSNNQLMGTSQSSMMKKQEIWLRCNDSNVQRMDKQDVISKDAYILFFKRKEFTASNIINLTSLQF